MGLKYSIKKHIYHDRSLGFTIKARACKGVGREWNPKLTFYAPKSVGECEGMNPCIGLPLWELESRWILEYSKSDYKGQNSLDWKIPYTIEKLLKHICLKWARMTHLGIQNTSYGQKKVTNQNVNLTPDH
jgi:hypothetical protein